jgi:hypothetical protein
LPHPASSVHLLLELLSRLAEMTHREDHNELWLQVAEDITCCLSCADLSLLGTELFAIRAPPHNPTLSPPGLQIYDVAHGFCRKKFEKTKGDHDEVCCTPRGHHPQCHLR